jgi:hypothetical protein
MDTIYSSAGFFAGRGQNVVLTVLLYFSTHQRSAVSVIYEL